MLGWAEAAYSRCRVHVPRQVLPKRRLRPCAPSPLGEEPTGLGQLSSVAYGVGVKRYKGARRQRRLRRFTKPVLDMVSFLVDALGHLPSCTTPCYPANTAQSRHVTAYVAAAQLSWTLAAPHATQASMIAGQQPHTFGPTPMSLSMLSFPWGSLILNRSCWGTQLCGPLIMPLQFSLDQVADHNRTILPCLLCASLSKPIPSLHLPPRAAELSIANWRHRCGVPGLRLIARPAKGLKLDIQLW